MPNRFPERNSLKSDKDMVRGNSVQMVGSYEQKKKVVVTKWMDNKFVLMASTSTGKLPESTVRRWDKASKSYKNVTSPAVVSSYNANMGGVDICDQLMEYYRCLFKTRKWTLKTIMHFHDLSVVNSFQQYKRACQLRGQRKTLDLCSFKLHVAEALLDAPPPPNEDLSDSEDEDVPRNRPAGLPSAARRYDQYGLFAVCEDLPAPLRCRLEDCNSRSRIRCSKCNVYLCLNKNKNCFLGFHVQN